MSKLALAIVAGLAARATAGPAIDTVMLDGQFSLGVAPMAMGSMHYEHHFADSNLGLTLRAMGGVGGYLDEDADRTFTTWTGLVGIRRHGTGRGYAEVEVGVMTLRDDRYTTGDDPFEPMQVHGVTWHVIPDVQGTLGFRAGPLDLGIVVQLPELGIGFKLGIAIDG